MATSILLKLLTLKWNISRTIWRIEVGDGSFFALFVLFHLSLTFCRPEVPFKSQKAFFKHVSWSDVVSILLKLLYFMTIKTGLNPSILPLLLDLSVLYVQIKRTKLNILYKD